MERTTGIDSRIDGVTVYAKGARITRVAQVTAFDRPTEVRIVGLPLALDDASVRVAARGAVAAGVRIALESPVAAATEAPADDAALEAARRRAALAQAEHARLTRAIAELELLAPPPRAEPGEGPRPAWGAALEARLALVALRGAREAALRAARAEAAQRADRAQRELAIEEDRARRASTARAVRPHELRKSAVISLRPASADGAADVTLTIEYLVPGAQWAPTYVARLDGARVRIELRAVIAQRTGEDWRGVALALSTAAAQRFTELPELPAARIGKRQPAPPRPGWRPPPTGVDELYRDWDGAFGAQRALRPPPPPEPEPVTEVYEQAPPIEQEKSADLRRHAAKPTMVFAAPMAAPMAAAPPVQARARTVMMGAMPQKKGVAMDRAEGGGRGGAAVGGVPADSAGTEAAELTAPSSLLAYGELMMPSPAQAGRGRLVRVTRRERYLALALSVVEIDTDVVALVDDAARVAQQLAVGPRGTQSGWTSAFDYAYRGQGRVDVPSDGGWHAVALGTEDAPLAVRHVVVPRETTDVFRVAELRSPFEAPMLPGPMDVYDGKDFVLTTQLADTPPRGAITLGLGVDQRVKVARNAEYREEAAGMLRGALRLEHKVKVTVENLGPRRIDLEVRERVPVPVVGDDDVAVGVDRVAPLWEAWTPEPTGPGQAVLRGGHRWRLAVEPGGKSDLVADYHVRISGKHELIGGNRREP